MKPAMLLECCSPEESRANSEFWGAPEMDGNIE